MCVQIYSVCARHLVDCGYLQTSGDLCRFLFQFYVFLFYFIPTFFYFLIRLYSHVFILTAVFWLTFEAIVCSRSLWMMSQCLLTELGIFFDISWFSFSFSHWCRRLSVQMLAAGVFKEFFSASSYYDSYCTTLLLLKINPAADLTDYVWPL